MKKSARYQIFDIIQIGNIGDFPSRTFDILLIFMIIANLFIAIVETFDIPAVLFSTLNVVEFITVIFFTVEYALRVWTADYLYEGKSRPKAILRYVCSGGGLIDLLSFLPYYLPVIFPGGAVAFRMFRVIRILRLFRINAYYDAFNVIVDVLAAKKNQLLSSIFIILIMMTASSICMYGLEHEAQPEVFKNAFSGFWWSTATLLTVGYGDIYPITFLGRLFGMIITFLGVGMVAIPTGILSAGFVEKYTEIKRAEERVAKSHLIQDDIRVLKLDGVNKKWIGKRLGDVKLPDGMDVAMLRRANGDLVLPQLDVEIHKGDVLIVYEEEGR